MKIIDLRNKRIEETTPKHDPDSLESFNEAHRHISTADWIKLSTLNGYQDPKHHINSGQEHWIKLVVNKRFWFGSSRYYTLYELYKNSRRVNDEYQFCKDADALLLAFMKVGFRWHRVYKRVSKFGEELYEVQKYS